MEKIKNKLKKRGSILAFTLIILGITLMAAISVATVTALDRKNANSTSQSVKAFQVANSAAEDALQKIENNQGKTIATANDGSSLYSWDGCSGGPSVTTISVYNIAGGTAKLNFYDGSGGNLGCGDSVGKIATIKVSGEFGGTTRAIEMAAAASYSFTYYCYNNGMGTPECGNSTSGHCPDGFVEKKDIGRWGMCYDGQAVDVKNYFLPPSGSSLQSEQSECKNSATPFIFGNAYICSGS
jgi:uncharacterized protein (UPF0333 family)